MPAVLPEVGADLATINAARKERLILLRNQVHALCLLRVPQANGIEREIEAIASDRAALQAFDKDLPCAIIDRVGGDLPRADELGIDTINAQHGDWLFQLQGWLQRALEGSG